MNAEKLQSLTDALEYIEENLSGDISQEDCARSACCSLSGLQKMFRYIFHRSVGEYVTARRLTKAAQDLQKGELSVLEIAIKYGYGSAEAFTRAFSRLWGMTPTAYRREWSFSGICPKLDFPRHTLYEGVLIMTNRFDISELYDYIRGKKGTYMLSFDISHLTPINRDHGSEAGDKVILEGLRRIDAECAEGMLMFRIGGDEFTLVTGLSDKAEVEKLAEKILSRNGEPINHNGVDIPVSMRAGAVLITGRPTYSELFVKLTAAPPLEPGKLVFIDE